jgi:hypothetical protein
MKSKSAGGTRIATPRDLARTRGGRNAHVLITRSAERDEDARELAQQLDARVAELVQRGAPSHDDWTELLLDTGELETALIDALGETRDDIDAFRELLRGMSRDIATGFIQSWRGPPRDSTDLLRAVKPMVYSLARETRVRRVRCRVPEGYAYSSLYPETYVDASDQFIAACAPTAVTVVGIRSIGTSLAAVVAAALARAGVDAYDFTIRPRGNPLDRCVELAPALARRVQDRKRGWFAIVDEGPGPSGSSFAAVTDAMLELGVAEDRIVYMPSRVPEPEALSNPRARARWARHRKFVGSFERLWLSSGRLAHAWGGELTADWSAGKWRDALFTGAADRPPVHPQHERRKFIITRNNGDRLLVKFNGLARYGRSRLDAARAMEQSGFGPRVAGAAGGFIATYFVDGRVTMRQQMSRRDLERVGQYVAARPESPRSVGASPADLREMIMANVRESCGEDLVASADSLISRADMRPRRVTIDGRLTAHEWIRTHADLVKADGVEHHDDHFFPGCQDAAWDVAGACVELCDDNDARALLIDAYASRSGDASPRERLPYWELAYLAFRAGYTAVAASSLKGTADGTGMRRWSDIYRERLRSALAANVTAQ